MTDVQAVKDALRLQRIELPSWAFGNSGTRFKVFAQRGVPRNPYEKIADAAQVHAFTGVAPSVALHIPWDRVDDFTDLAKHAASFGMRLGAINSNVFQDNDYMLGSVTNPDPRVRRKATDHLLECVDIMDADGIKGPQAVVLRRHQLSRPGRHPGATGTPGSRAGRGVRPPRRRPAVPARVQAVRAGLLHDGCARLGHRPGSLPRPRPEGHGRRRHRPPRARHEHRVHRGDAAAGRQARWVRLQLPVLRRRRPDGRLGRSVPTVPDHVGGSSRWRASIRHSVSPSCSINATTSNRRSPPRSAR